MSLDTIKVNLVPTTIHIIFQVSWIRLADLNLLTVGGYTYTSDLRFEAKHVKNTRDWNLVLREAKVSDTGIYQNFLKLS